MDTLGKAAPTPSPSFPLLGYPKHLGVVRAPFMHPHMGLAERRGARSPGFLILCDVKSLCLSLTQFSHLANGEKLPALQ